MQQAEYMDQLVYDLIAHYEADVLPTGLIRLALRMQGHGMLIIEEKCKEQQMSVCYVLFNVEGNPVPEPEILFYIDADGHWIPYEFRRITAGHRAFAILDRTGGELLVTDLKSQQALAHYTDLWAEVLRAQGWVELARKQPAELLVLPPSDGLWFRHLD